MTARPPKETLILDMPFGEALERYAGVDPKEVQAGVVRSKKKKPGGKKKRKPPGAKVKPGNVISLRERHMSRKRRGLA